MNYNYWMRLIQEKAVAQIDELKRISEMEPANALPLDCCTPSVVEWIRTNPKEKLPPLLRRRFLRGVERKYTENKTPDSLVAYAKERVEKAFKSVAEPLYIELTHSRSIAYGTRMSRARTVGPEPIYKATASGCGYDKDSTALTRVLVQTPMVDKLLFEFHEQAPEKMERHEQQGSVIYTDIGLPVLITDGKGVAVIQDFFQDFNVGFEILQTGNQQLIRIFP